MKLFFRLPFNRFLASTGVVLFVMGVPNFGVLAAPPTCEIVHKKPTKAVKWTEIESHEARVDYIIQTFTTGAQNFYEPRRFATEIQKMGEARQKDWILAIGAAYRKVPKKDPNPFAARHIGGRRVLDHVLTLLENYQNKFDSEINQKGATPFEAYRHFMNRQNELFGTQYNSKAVETVISVIQTELKRIEASYQRGPLLILISGSFPNGKADLRSSDIDLSLSDAGIMKETYDWQNLINTAFKNAGVESNLELAFSTEGTYFYGKINPVIIQVSPNEVKLLVFPPGVPRQGSDELDAGQAQVYILQKN